MESLAAHRRWGSAPGTELICRDGRDCLTDHLVVGAYQAQIGELRTTVQRRNPAADINIANIRNVGDVGYVHLIKARTVASPPGIEPVRWSD
ncbi:MAG TPA: hypothetical protein VF767_09625, partial [Bryobacteraceae bacterium]